MTRAVYLSCDTCYLWQDTEVTSLQTRLQAGLVERLEEQLGEERARLAAMLDHLHLARDQSPVSGDPISIPVLDHLHLHLARDQSPVSGNPISIPVLDHLHLARDQSPVSPHPLTRAPSPACSSQEQRPPQTYATMIRQVAA